MTPPKTGDTFTVTRTFTTEDVRRFAALSGDAQDRHTEPRGTDTGSDARLLVHGLLTATLPTQIGGDLEVLARSMTFDFRRPVYTGETISCVWSTDSVREREDRYVLEASVHCENLRTEVVLTGTVEGLIWKDDADTAGGP